MQLSKYSVLHSNENCGYIFDTRKETVTVVSLPLFRAIETGSFKGIPASALATLFHKGVLVPDSKNETQQVHEQILNRRIHHDLRLVLVPTYSCNLRCSYCYAKQATAAASDHLPQWQDDVIDFIKKRLALKKEKHLTLALFGGEPLLQAALCRAVLQNAKQVMDGFGGSIYRTLTTNGSIYNQAVDQLLEQIDYCQVTLDGVGPCHDRHRRFCNGKGSYGRIIKFIKKAIEKQCNTTIRFHLHDYEPDYLQHCAHVLRKDLDAGAKVSIYFAKLAGGCYSDTFKCSFRDTQARNGTKPHEIARDRFLAAGWPAEQIYLHNKGNTTVSCAARCGYIGTESFLIDSGNNIFFCPVALNNPRLRIGKLSRKNYRFFPLRDQLLKHFEIDGECRHCALLPLCEQGCPTKALVNNQRPDSVVCEKNQLLSNVIQRCENTKLHL